LEQRLFRTGRRWTQAVEAGFASEVSRNCWVDVLYIPTNFRKLEGKKWIGVPKVNSREVDGGGD